VNAPPHSIDVSHQVLLHIMAIERRCFDRTKKINKKNQKTMECRDEPTRNEKDRLSHRPRDHIFGSRIGALLRNVCLSPNQLEVCGGQQSDTGGTFSVKNQERKAERQQTTPERRPQTRQTMFQEAQPVTPFVGCVGEGTPKPFQTKLWDP